MQLKGKKVLILGDSITEGVGVSSTEKRYADVFAKMTERRVLNYGICGTRYAKKRIPSAKPEYDQDFISRVEKMEPGADIVVVFGGTNDFAHGDAPLGNFEDRDPYTFYGACHILYSSLIEKYPEAVIVILTPLHRREEENTVNELGMPCEKLSEFVKAEKETAEYYSLPVLDLFAVSGLQPAIPVICEKYMRDGLHPTDAGAKRIAERLKGFLESL